MIPKDMTQEEYDRAVNRRLWMRRAKALAGLAPLAALFGAFGALALLFKLLGWEE